MKEFESLGIQQEYSLKDLNTLGIDVNAAYFISVTSESQLKNVLRSGITDEVPLFILGGGSNVLFIKDFEGLVLHIAINGFEVIEEDEEHVWVEIGAGENWHDIVTRCVEKGWGGIENLSLIPGTAGAAPIQNIGAYGVELEEVFESLDAVEVESGDSRKFTKEECNFGYRDSVFKHELKGKYIVTAVVLRLSKNPTLHTEYGAIQSMLEKRKIEDPDIKDISRIVIDIRNSKLPNPEDIGNAGSFFKNPVIPESRYQELKNEYHEMPGYPVGGGEMKVPAGWLIEYTGWKGKSIGNVGTYRQQALVIVNHGGAEGLEVLQFARQIQHHVKEVFGIELEPEVNLVG